MNIFYRGNLWPAFICLNLFKNNLRRDFSDDQVRLRLRVHATMRHRNKKVLTGCLENVRKQNDAWGLAYLFYNKNG
jgi:hypothetical protein